MKFLSLLTLLLLAGCGGCNEPLRGGIVTNTHFYPAHWITVDDPPIKIGNQSIPQSHQEWVPDKWDLLISDEGRTAVYIITGEEFARVKIGQYWNFYEQGPQ